MKKLAILSMFMFLIAPAFAAYCPSGNQYIEMMSYGMPDNDKEKQALTDKMTTELKNKYPRSEVACGVKDNKYYYCVACPQ